MFPTLLLLTCLTTQMSVQENVHASLPLHGTVHKNTLYGYFGTEGDYLLDAIPVVNPPKARSLGYLQDFLGKRLEDPTKPGWKCYYVLSSPLGVKFGRNYRHQIKYESIWISLGYSPVDCLKLDELNLFDTSNKHFAEQQLKKYPFRKGETTVFHEIDLPTLAERYWQSFRETDAPDIYSPARNVVAVGSVATSANSLKCFMLIKPKEHVEIWDTDFRWDDKIERWKTVADGKNLEKIEAPFAENFHFFVRRNEYYFVTQSGELYIAPPPKKGEKSRTMTAIWDDKTRPIVGIIEDADKDKVWLFAETKKGDPKRGYYFEMNSKTRYEEFDPAKLRKVEVESPRARQLLEYIPLIRPDLAKKPAP